MDETDRAIVNRLQGGFPVSDRPFAEAAASLGLEEGELIARIDRLLATGTLTRFGPLFQIERAGGAFTLAAMAVPREDFDRVAAIVSAYPEVAHNYERDHAFNLWFVLATACPEAIEGTISAIAAATGYPVYNFPKQREYFVELRLAA